MKKCAFVWEMPRALYVRVLRKFGGVGAAEFAGLMGRNGTGEDLHAAAESSFALRAEVC